MKTYECYGISDLFHTAWQVRKTVFVDEQNVPIEIERDHIDERAWHVLIQDDNRPVATGRLFELESKKYCIGRVAVLSEYRGKGLGKLIMKCLIKKAWDIGAVSIELHAQTYAKAFYSDLGFVESGAPYFEAGIEHITMHISK